MFRRLTPYLRLMRFDKPIGLFLLLWPTLWALWFAAEGMPAIPILCIFILGAVLMRSLGCIINDIADRKIDPLVARTANRPLASGELTLPQALSAFVLLSILALSLLWFLNPMCWLIAVLAFLMTCLYPFTKRFFFMPQLVLGVTFAAGVPMAFAAVLNHIPLLGWWVYLAAVCWIVAFDTAYAMADRAEDKQVGIHSSALTLGDRECLFILSMECLQWLALLMAWAISTASYVFLIGLAIVGIFYYFQYSHLVSRDPKRCFAVFMNNNWVGLVIFASLILSFLL